MGRRHRSRGRDVNGILILDKPVGISSNDAVQRVKRLYFARKVGHTGSLDPLATGVLPLCFGEATKFSKYLLNADKRYFVVARLGVATDSGDKDGTIISERPVPALCVEDLNQALEKYRGDIEQLPSMFSALKRNGQPLYKLARQGIEVEREKRAISIYRNDVVHLEGDTFHLEIHCSKGTYVRTIVADLGEDLGCGAHVTALRRRSVGPFHESTAIALDQVLEARERKSADDLLLPIASVVSDWPEVKLNQFMAYHVRHGQPIQIPHSPTQGWVRLSEESGDETADRFLGVGEILDDGRVAPRRIIA